MELSDLKKYLNNIGLPADYSVNADKAKGDEVKGFDQLTISWKDDDISKSVQIYPEIIEMNIKRWKLNYPHSLPFRELIYCPVKKKTSERAVQTPIFYYSFTIRIWNSN